VTLVTPYFFRFLQLTHLEEAARWDSDLIVLGSNGYGGWQRFLLGSV
jgi:nucleotide-binding universal stress UspA family protein